MSFVIAGAIILAQLSLPTLALAETDGRKLRVAIWNGEAPKESVYNFEESINKKLDVTGTSFECIVTPQGAPPPLKFSGYTLKCSSKKSEIGIETSANCYQGSDEATELMNSSAVGKLTFNEGKVIRTIWIGCSKKPYLSAK